MDIEYLPSVAPQLSQFTSMCNDPMCSEFCGTRASASSLGGVPKNLCASGALVSQPQTNPCGKTGGNLGYTPYFNMTNVHSLLGHAGEQSHELSRISSIGSGKRGSDSNNSHVQRQPHVPGLGSI